MERLRTAQNSSPPKNPLPPRPTPPYGLPMADTPTRLPLKERLSKLISDYGPVAFVTWFVLFGLTLAGFVLAIKLGFKPEGAAGGAGTLGAAYVATQLTKPLRILATLALTPVIGKAVEKLRGKRKQPDAKP